MKICPKEMERRGTASIFKESVTLLHKHYRLFLIDVVVYYFPILIFIVYETLILVPPSIGASVEKGSVNPAQTTDPPRVFPLSTVGQWTTGFVVAVLGSYSHLEAKEKALAAYLNNPTPTEEDRFIIPEVPRFHVNASLRSYIIEIYILLAFFSHSLLFVIIGGLLQAIIFATAGLADPKLFFSDVLSYIIVFIIGFAILVALVQTIFVLVHWSRETRKRSAELKRDRHRGVGFGVQNVLGSGVGGDVFRT